MKTLLSFRFRFHGLAVLTSLLLSLSVLNAEEAPPAAHRELALVFSESISTQGDSSDTYVRLSDNFERVFTARKWPLTYRTERLAAGVQEFPLELKVFSMGIHHDMPNELIFRAWVILMVDGKKYDFGIIRVQHIIRPFQSMGDTMEALYSQTAKAVADKIEPVLFRRTTTGKTS